jgi:hypothetical protein
MMQTSPAGSAVAEGEEVTSMVDESLKLLRQIIAAGGRKYTAGNIDRSRSQASKGTLRRLLKNSGETS